LRDNSRYNNKVLFNAVIKENPNKDKDYVPHSNSGMLSMKKNLEI
jgi:hypothetical protein